MRSIGNLVKERISLIGFDPINAAGYTQIPNTILKDKKLTIGGKICYAVLLSYAWQNDGCFPGQEKMAKDIGGGERSVVRYIQELVKSGYVVKKRIGLGKTNRYYLYASVKKGRVVGKTR